MLEDEQKTVDTARQIGPYILGQTLGKGGYSWVKKGVVEKTNAVVALKFTLRSRRKGLKDQAERVRTEIQAMLKLNHPHVMKLLAYDLQCNYPDKTGKTLNTIMLVLDYCPGGELFDILYYTKKLSPTTARTYFVQLMQGLKACHDIGIIHRDIKPQNLLLGANYELKITDFGLSFISKQEGDLNSMRTGCGTRGYQAPELLKGDVYTKACDIFSCGVVLFILITGYPPFEQAWRADKWYNPLCESKPKEFWSSHHNAKIDADCKALLTGMFAYRAKNRLTLGGCLEHKWVNNREIHSGKDLEALVKKKHQATGMLRRKDKDKMQDMENSVKQRKKREICQCLTKKNSGEFQNSRCRICNGFELPVSENFVPTLLTFFAPKKYLHQAYNVAANIFSLAFKGKSQTNFSSGNPWNVRTIVKVHNGESEQKFTVALYIRLIGRSEVVAFQFKRLQGDSIGFGRIWNAVEEHLLKYSGSIICDDMAKCFKIGAEIKEDG